MSLSITVCFRLSRQVSFGHRAAETTLLTQRCFQIYKCINTDTTFWLLLFCCFTSMAMWGRSVIITTLFMDRLKPPKQLTSTKVHILSPVTLLESAEGETKVRCQTGYRTSDPWLLSQTLSMMVYATFQYSLNALFCEPSEICEYKRKLCMNCVPEFCTKLTFTNLWASEAQRRRSLLSSKPTSVGIRHTANGAPLHAELLSLSV